MAGEGPQTPLAARSPARLTAAVRRHPWRTLALGVCLLLVLAIGVLSNPQLQKRWLLPRIAPLVERVDVESLQLTPWSVSLRGLDLQWQGMVVKIAEARVVVNPFGLITDTIQVRRLTLTGAELDLRRYRPGPPPTAPFPGLLTVLDIGYGVALNGVDAAANVILPEGQRATVSLRGGGVRPHISGTLDYTLALSGDAQQIDAAGQLTIEQLSHGRFRRLQAAAEVTLALPALPGAERFALTLEAAPAPGAGGARYLAREARGTEPPPPETVALTLRSLDHQHAERARLDFSGLYRGADGSLRGRYTLEANQALVTPFTGPHAIPDFALNGQGTLGVETVNGALDLTFDAATAVTQLARVLGENAALPAALTLQSGVTLARNGQRLVLTRLDNTLSDPSQASRVVLEVQTPLVIDVADPAALLAAPRVFGTLAIAGVPLPWINGLLDGQQLEGGTLSAGFEIASDDKSRLQLLPLQQLMVGDVAVKAGADVLAPHLRLSLLPRITRAADHLRIRVDQLVLADGEQQLLTGKLRFTQPLPASAEASLRLSYDLKANVDALLALPPLAVRAEAYPLPAELGVHAKGDVALLGRQLTIAALDASLAQAARAAVVRVLARQAFVLPAAGKAFKNPRGELATLSLRGFDLAWVSALLEGVDLQGTIASADLLLTAPDATRLAVAGTAPLRIDGLSAGMNGQPMVTNLRVDTSPSVDYSAQRLRFDLRQLNIASAGNSLVRGQLAGTVPLAAGGKDALEGDGRLELDLRALASQPAVSRALDRAPPDLAVNATLDFAAAQRSDMIEVERLVANMQVGRRATFALSAKSGLVVRPVLTRGERLARHVVGGVELKIRDLASSVIERVFALEGIRFSEINADLRLNSDGAVLTADSAAPLSLERVRVNAGEQALLNRFALSTVASFVVEEQEVRLNLADLALTFDGEQRPALSGRVAAAIEPGRTVPLTHLSTAFVAELPQWLAQPTVMPGHKLTAGALTATIDVTSDGAIAARAALDGLAASAPLAISHIELPVTGRMAPDGRGFSFTAPLTADGRSGTGNALVVANYAPEPDTKGLLRLRMESALFYLNDLLATVTAIAPARSGAPAPADAAAPAAAAPVAVDRTRDTKAAWKVLPYGTELEYAIDKLYYTDYLAFDDVRGKLSVRARKLSLTEAAARFHDSPMRLDGTLTFRPAEAEPYLLDVNGTVTDFDLNQFFKELVPGEKPRIKGLFSVKLQANGEMPNLGQLRNETLFDVRMRSRKGVFRPLPPSSTLLASTSDVLGLVGEGLSYVPTGGFGAGTIARLVNYIARIEYDIVDIHIRRPENQGVAIERFLVQSDTISMAATGGISRVPGKDILDSPLDLRANLDMSGRGAAILYSMGLLRDEQNDDGYWRGPEFKIWGTPAASESNFADIIRQASDGTVKGGITRPLSGLIGNLKYRWFGKKPRAAVVEGDNSEE